MLVAFLSLNGCLCFSIFHHKPAIVAIALVLPIGLQKWKKISSLWQQRHSLEASAELLVLLL